MGLEPLTSPHYKSDVQPTAPCHPCLLYENIYHISPNKLHGTCLYNGHWTLDNLYSVVTTRQCNPPMSQFNSLCNEFTGFWSMFMYITKTINLCLSLRLHTSKQLGFVNYTHNVSIIEQSSSLTLTLR